MKINDIPEAFSVTLRLKILSCLITDSKTFNEVLDITGATKGNLSTQLLKLENWGYLTSCKRIENRKTKTTYTITTFGLRQFEEYVNLLQRILNPPFES
ncbi:MAG: ArsR family transcriptional regulator [Lachnospiraceae bacterium]|nr:ArsR family transcriptional regulator [Lachnospiraceae bacterium]MBD5525672.1 ArsR family transcriptional regulator [Lachnospiraceae bacterium]